jgi:hypothetical protein
MTSSHPVHPKTDPTVIGWREHIALPQLGISTMPAKIDTGARTAALHAVDQRIVEVEGRPWVAFKVPIHNRRTARIVHAPLVDERDIKNTGGVPERRLIVQTLLLIGRHRWHIEVSLANRERMEFDLILGRTAIRRRGIVVDPGRSFALGRRPVPQAPAPEAAALAGATKLEGHKT